MKPNSAIKPFGSKPGVWILAVLLLAGCAAKGDHPNTPPAPPAAGIRENGILIVTPADNNHTAVLKVGERLEVRLPENPSTGYGWAVDDTNPRLLNLDNATYTPPTENGFIGTRGRRTFFFTTRQPGEVALKFKYWRVWLGDDSIKERFAVTLQIHD